jgi:hypothetical protein
MSLFSSRLVLVLGVINLMVLFFGGLFLVFYGATDLPVPLALEQRKISPERQERHQKSALQLASLQGRPLFHENRKAYIVKTVGPVAAPVQRKVNPLTAYQLKGIVYIADNKSLAILFHRNSQKSRRLKMGDIIEGWTVAAIEKTVVRLSRGAETAELKLRAAENNNR